MVPAKELPINLCTLRTYRTPLNYLLPWLLRNTNKSVLQHIVMDLMDEELQTFTSFLGTLGSALKVLDIIFAERGFGKKFDPCRHAF